MPTDHSHEKMELCWDIIGQHIEILMINTNYDGYVSVGFCDPGTYGNAFDQTDETKGNGRDILSTKCTYVVGSVLNNGVASCWDMYDFLPQQNIGR